MSFKTETVVLNELSQTHIVCHETPRLGKKSSFLLYKNSIIKFKHVLPYKSIHTQEALYRIVECYTILGLDIHAARYFGILKHNFPNSNWYAQGLENFKNCSKRVQNVPM